MPATKQIRVKNGDLEGLATPLTVSCEIAILPAVSGGR
jgi:molybdopterin converting factor small subunit